MMCKLCKIYKEPNETTLKAIEESVKNINKAIPLNLDKYNKGKTKKKKK